MEGKFSPPPLPFYPVHFLCLEILTVLTLLWRPTHMCDNLEGETADWLSLEES